MRGAIPPLPPYVFITRCFVKQRDSFTFNLTFWRVYTELPRSPYPSGWPRFLKNFWSPYMCSTCPILHIYDLIDLMIPTEKHNLWRSSLCSLHQPTVTFSHLGPHILLSTLYSSVLHYICTALLQRKFCVLFYENFVYFHVPIGNNKRTLGQNLKIKEPHEESNQHTTCVSLSESWTRFSLSLLPGRVGK
jgi:hypothetical protein